MEGAVDRLLADRRVDLGAGERGSFAAWSVLSVVRCVLDASVVLAWLFGERGGEVVDEMLEHAAISTVNLADVLYRADEGRRGDGDASARPGGTRATGCPVP
jgi:hypothetical protein